MPLNRRQFVRHSTQAALALGAWGTWKNIEAHAEPTAAKDSLPATMPAIVDTHQHLWDLSKLRLSWLKADSELGRNYVMKDYLEATQGLNVVKAVYMEVAVDRDCQLTEAQLVEDLCRRGGTPTVAAVIGGCPGEDDFRDYILRFKDSPYIKGVRQIPRPPTGKPGLYREAKFTQGIRFLGELGMSFDLCIPPEQLPDAARLVDGCPGTRFILDHCGNADPNAFRPAAAGEAAESLAARRRACDQWRRDLAALAKRKNVVCKISGIVSRMAKGHWSPDDLAPVINHCLDAFGPDRVMFAGDWPVCTRGATLRGWVLALLDVIRSRSPEDQGKLLHDNAVRFYGLKA
jgi:predicted TIM-barrel fold metal-dependent hydrolase